MCRRGGGDTGRTALYSVGEGKEPLRVRAFYVRLAVRPGVCLAPESLTLVYLPRISGAPLEVNGERVRPDAPAFVALHRVRSAESGGDLVYGSTDRVRARDGVRFEAYVGGERALRGSFRRRGNGEWRLECGCAGAVGVAEAAELCVAGEGEVLMTERVDMTAAASRRGRFWSGLEEIPEELEEGEGYCDCCGGEGEEDGWDVLRLSDQSDSEFDDDDDDDAIGERKWKLEKEEGAEEAGLEGVKWAVDLGICAVCLGVGFLVSKASFKKRRSFLSF